MGQAHTSLNKNTDHYEIKVEAFTQGFAKFLSNNRQEVYESKGKVIGDILYPLEFKKVKSTNRYHKTKKYIFDHKNKKVFLYKNDFNKDTNETSSSEEEFGYYAKNDILSLYFNLINIIKYEDKSHMVFYAVGAKENDGKVDIIKPDSDDLIQIKELMELDKDLFLQVRINQNIFSSSDGEMIINIGNDNICNKAILKDVLLFGDITAVKVD